jgi:hypothetical protein
MVFDWSNEKNEKLKKERNIQFEEIVVAIQNGGLVRRLQHTNPEKYSDQELLLVILNDYVYVVPAVPTGNGYFLKTIYKSRKYTRMILGDKNER